MDDIYKNIEEYNPNKKCKRLIVFDDIIADMLSNRGRNLNICFLFLTQFYFAIVKDIRLNSTHYFITKIPNKRELQRITFNHSSDIEFKDFMNLHKTCTGKPHSFSVIDATLASANPSRFIDNLLERI